MLALLRRFRKDERGATAIEYGLLAALIAVAIIVAVATLGKNLSNLFTNVSTSIGNQNPAPVAKQNP